DHREEQKVIDRSRQPDIALSDHVSEITVHELILAGKIGERRARQDCRHYTLAPIPLQLFVAKPPLLQITKHHKKHNRAEYQHSGGAKQRSERIILETSGIGGKPEISRDSGAQVADAVIKNQSRTDEHMRHRTEQDSQPVTLIAGPDQN